MEILQQLNKVEALDPMFNLVVQGVVIQGSNYYEGYPYQVLVMHPQDERLPISYTSIAPSGHSRKIGMVWKKIEGETCWKF